MDVPLLTRNDGFCPTGYEPLTVNTKTGIRRYYKRTGVIDEDGMPEVKVITVQPVQDVLDQNQRDKYSGKGTFTKKGKWGAHVGRIPMTMLNEMRYHKDGTKLDEDEFMKAVKDRFMDSDYSKLRTGEFSL